MGSSIPKCGTLWGHPSNRGKCINRMMSAYYRPVTTCSIRGAWQQAQNGQAASLFRCCAHTFLDFFSMLFASPSPDFFVVCSSSMRDEKQQQQPNHFRSTEAAGRNRQLCLGPRELGVVDCRTHCAPRRSRVLCIRCRLFFPALLSTSSWTLRATLLIGSPRFRPHWLHP